MAAFSGFAPPKTRVSLRNEKFSLEIWPEVAGAVARFDLMDGQKTVRPLFRPVVEGKAVYTAPDDLGCWPLVPYSNRIDHGRINFEGKAYDLPLNVGDNPHVLHGVGWQRSWALDEQAKDACRLTLRHASDLNWPFAFSAEQLFSLNPDGLTITLSLTNEGDGTMPYGLGFHPYIFRSEGTKLFADARGVWFSDEHAMPTMHTNDIPKEWDLRSGCLLDKIFIDQCYEPFEGSPKVVWADGASLTVEHSECLKYLVVYNPPEQQFVCVEPVSHMVDAFNRHAKGEKNVGFTVLRPSEKTSITYRFVYAESV
jgi:aldose 1-epimerase